MRFQVKMTPALQRYIEDMSVREPDLLRDLRKVTSEMLRGSDLGFAARLMQTSPEQGQFLSLLVRATGARRAVEVGVFTGYSLLSTALALPEDGTVIGCDISEEYTAIAREYVDRAGVGHKVRLRVGDAKDSLVALIEEGAAGTIDFVFIDADKVSYASYYESALTLLRPGGMLVVDNVLWHGQVVDPQADGPEPTALRSFNAALHADDRIDISLLGIADGMTLAVKR